MRTVFERSGDKAWFPGKIIEINSQKEFDVFNLPHTHVFDSAEGVISTGFQRNFKIIGLCCSCKHIRLL